MSSLVLELFWVRGKFPGRPYVAVVHMGIHGWFLAWPLWHDKRKFEKLKNGNSSLQNRYVDSASRIPVSDL